VVVLAGSWQAACNGLEASQVNNPFLFTASKTLFWWLESRLSPRMFLVCTRAPLSRPSLADCLCPTGNRHTGFERRATKPSASGYVPDSPTICWGIRAKNVAIWAFGAQNPKGVLTPKEMAAKARLNHRNSRSWRG